MCSAPFDDELSSPASPDEYSIYVHLPGKIATSTRDASFANALCISLSHEWAHRQPSTADMRLRSVYFGGKGATSFSVENFERLLKLFSCANNAEITLEIGSARANFKTLKTLRQIGVNRIALNVGARRSSFSLKSNRLRALSNDLRDVETLQNAGFANISIDVLFTAPNQSLECWQETLNQVRTWPIRHISMSEYRHKIHSAPSDETSKRSAQMFDAWGTAFPSDQWRRYEIFAYCKPGSASIHNSGYLRGRAYWGLGPGACSFWNAQRLQNSRAIASYIKGGECSGISPKGEVLSREHRLRELFLCHLRILAGVDLTAFAKRYGSLPIAPSKWSLWKSQRLIKTNGSRLQLTTRGLRYYDALAADLI